MDIASENFGRRLKSQRERRGIALQTIAASTKINRSLLADLERGDVSKWPRGIFRRAFVREYAASVGLAPETVVTEFVELFPDEESGQPAPSLEHAAHLRLTFAEGERASLLTIAQAAAALLEICAILALSRTLTWSTGLNFWAVCGAGSLAYYGVASACCGRSLGLWWLHTARQRRAERDEPARSNARDLLDLIVTQDGAAGGENLQTASGVILRS
jgi:transcriptional regulator with XRE-family HTH domain